VNVLDMHAAIFVNKIPKVAKLAVLPIKQPTKFGFISNLKTAKASGSHDSSAGTLGGLGFAGLP